MSEYQGEEYNIAPVSNRFDTGARPLYGFYSYEYAMTRNNGKAWYYLDVDKKEPVIITNIMTHMDTESLDRLKNVYPDMMYVGMVKFRVGPCSDPPNIKGIYVHDGAKKSLQKPWYPILSILPDELFEIEV